MSTSLAAQLQKLATPATDVLINDKKRSTLLFDPKEAASISSEVIYEIGLEGLHQLIARNENFKPFLQTLFHNSSKHFDRYVHSKEDNKKLNKKIRKFLVLVAPYILLNPAQKALEWLFNRYRINENNKTDLLLAVLPHYNSKIFCRIIQTCRFQNVSDPFYFLKTVHKSNMTVPTSNLFHQALSNFQLVKLMIKFLTQLLKTHQSNVLTMYFNFYSTVFCGAIEFSPEIQEPFITELLPFITKGIKSSIPDFASAALVITARLLSKCSVTEKLLSRFVNTLSELKCPTLKLENTLSLVLIYQLQPQFEVLSSDALANFAKTNWLVECLSYLHSNGNYVYPFLRVLLRNALNYEGEEYQAEIQEMILEIVKQLEFDGSFISDVLGLVLNKVDSEDLEKNCPTSWLQDIIKQLQLKYKVQFDEALKDIPESKRNIVLSLLEEVNEAISTKPKQYSVKRDKETLRDISKRIDKLPVKDLYLLIREISQELNRYNLRTVTKGILQCLDSILSKTFDSGQNWCSLDAIQYSDFFTELINLSFSDAKFKSIFEVFLAKISTDGNIALNICIAGCFEPVTICKILRYVLRDKPETCLNGIYVLIMLSNKDPTIRKLVFDIIEQFDTTHKWLLQQLSNQQERILADNAQVGLLLTDILAHRTSSSNKAAVNLNQLMETICSNDTPMYVKWGILNCLSEVKKFDIVQTLCEHFVKLFENKTLDQCDLKILTNIVRRLDSNVMAQMSQNSPIWHFVVFVLNQKRIVIIDEEKIYLPNCMLNQLSRDVSAVLPEDVLENLLDLVCEQVALCEEPEFISLSSKLFKHLDLNAKIISKILVQMTSINSSKGRNRRGLVTPTVDILDSVAWKKGVSLLEFIQSKKKIKNPQVLLPILFDVLKKCLDFEEQAVVEYPKQLTLALVLLICCNVDENYVSESDFNIELVIQCIRASQNPQTHYHALLVLAHAAKIVPKDVLHHVMAVFTFMGTTLIRHDDAYSFEIISKIVDTIIPILVDAKQVTTISDVLRVFIDALLDVPEHRRIPLYTKLLTNVNVNENLYLFLLFVMEADVLQASREKTKIEKGVAPPRSKIALQLCQEFSPVTTLQACVQLAQYVNDLPDEKDDLPTSGSSSLPPSTNYTNKQFRHYKYLIITFLSSLLSSREFIVKIATLSKSENSSIESLYKELIIKVLSYIQRIQKVSDSSADSPQSLYWKTILHHSYELLDSINDLLSPRMFLLVIKGLLVHSMVNVKKRALELLNNKLQGNLLSFSEQDKKELCILIKPISLIVENESQETLIQTGLLSLKLIVIVLAPEEPEKFVPVLEFVASILNSGKMEGNVLASVVLCLAEVCAVLRAHGLAAIASFMPAFLHILKKQKYQETYSLLLLSVVTAVNKFLESFAAFLSPYLPKLICESSILLSKWGSCIEDSKCQPLIIRLNGIKKKLSTTIPARILISVIDECYNTLLAKRYYNALVALMDIMEEQLVSFQSMDVAQNMSELTALFLKALEFRSNHSPSLEVANLIENQVIKTLTVFTLKLSESSFRPFYLKLYDWARTNHERLITFYHISERIGQALKGLFVLFASNIFSNMSNIIHKIDEYAFDDIKKTVLLLEFVLKTLKTIFTYDNKKTLNRDRFQLIMQPLVDLLDKDIDGIDALVKRNEQLLTPTIVSFALALADDVFWKEMNYQVLLKMRNPKPELRLVALHCLAEVVAKLKEDFMPLLPETIPFLAELLEDEDERVEKACQKAIREMEKMLGEPLQKYF
uniref:HEAT repeat-containing protein 1 n=1 Tax=Dendroctonus ponderosae TaxID=77166 RepID=A0AAR5PVL6_DENPD